MLISWKWLQNLVETGDVTAADAAARITARGLEVEGHTPDPTHIADIRVSAKELRLAFNEARLLYGDRLVKADAEQIYNAREVLDFKNYLPNPA